MAKQQNPLIFVGIIVLVLLLINNYQKQDEMIGLTPHYLDKDGNEIFSIGGFTIVDGRSEVYEIYFDISATNQDVPIENIQVEDAYPQVFEDSLAGVTPQTLAVGESKVLWTSEPILAEQFESISPINFWIELSGENTLTDETIYPDRDYSGDISFVAEGEPPSGTGGTGLLDLVSNFIIFGGGPGSSISQCVGLGIGGEIVYPPVGETWLITAIDERLDGCTVGGLPVLGDNFDVRIFVDSTTGINCGSSNEEVCVSGERYNGEAFSVYLDNLDLIPPAGETWLVTAMNEISDGCSIAGIGAFTNYNTRLFIDSNAPILCGSNDRVTVNGVKV